MQTPVNLIMASKLEISSIYERASKAGISLPECEQLSLKRIIFGSVFGDDNHSWEYI